MTAPNRADWSGADRVAWLAGAVVVAVVRGVGLPSPVAGIVVGTVVRDDEFVPTAYRFLS